MPSTPSLLSARQTLLPMLRFITPYRGRIVIAITALVVVAGISLSLGQSVKLVINNLFVVQSQRELAVALGILAGLITMIAVGTFVRFYTMSWLGERVSADIRRAVFDHLLLLEPSYFEENQSGELMSRLTTDTTLLQTIVGSSFSMALRNALTLVGGIAMLLVTNLKLTALVLVGIPLALVPVLILGRRVRKLSRHSQDTIADVGSYAGEIIQNIKAVQSYTREAEERHAFGVEVEQAFAVARTRIRERAMLFGSVMLLMFLGICAMLWVGGSDVLAGTISPGDLGAFVFYALMVAMSLATLAEVYGEVQRAAGAAERLMELLQVEPDICDPPEPANMQNRAPANEQMAANASNAIELENVSFAYPSRPKKLALNNLSLTIKQGETVALVGPSGAGKSTLFELLERFYDPQQGEIRQFNHPYRALALADLRGRVGLVPQNPVLFSADVWRNIRYGNPQASDAAVMEAARKAHAHDFIAALPEGYDSFLGERGVRLSGGQKQRIAIARAILKDPPILLLDEATSALDAESEHYVQAALNDLMRERTTLIIAHRLATVVHADRILVMQDGEIIDSGTHTSLQTSSALYRRLCELQFATDELAKS
ncbi:ABC transporter transmembrane domain-containing protein [Teredinibacter turnerae]|uniref:ABC transporter transmembrane domain-containing protein n=1 Tax=Teredinibacter turnerae TaxID=2426 RepID=UPI00037AA785|nr:ABC transporter transmembrane domain-containing protein [Teredinibacter turnerae]